MLSSQFQFCQMKIACSDERLNLTMIQRRFTILGPKFLSLMNTTWNLELLYNSVDDHRLSGTSKRLFSLQEIREEMERKNEILRERKSSIRGVERL